MRFNLLLLFFFAGAAAAEWTGVAFELADYDSDWRFSGGNRDAQISSLGFQVEDRTDSGLRVGASIGYVDLRVVATTAAATKKFDGEFFSVYLRQPLPVTEYFTLHGKLSYRYASGDDDGRPTRSEIDWNETRLELGASLRLSALRITPFASYIDIDGDISDDQGTRVFSLDENLTRGIRVDYLLEPSAFVRLEFLSGGHSGGYLKFVRRY